jgi:filamentous hemagglutinin family protein
MCRQKIAKKIKRWYFFGACIHVPIFIAAICLARLETETQSALMQSRKQKTRSSVLTGNDLILKFNLLGSGMDHLYAVCSGYSWKALRAGVELPGGPQERSRFQLSRLLICTSILALSASFPGRSMADLPVAGSIMEGAGAIAVNGNSMTVTQSTSRMAIDWQSFNIGTGHAVEFIQPTTSAAALNRVVGADVSTIQGNLRANGQVFLLNPNGILFTPTAQVNVGGLVGSTLNISNADFMAGRLSFGGSSAASIINQGNLQAASGGTVALIAARIINEPGASVTVDGGQVLLGAGNKVTLDMGGPVRIKVEQGALQALIEQGGAVRADGGLIYMTAKSAEALGRTVINHTGVSRAQTAVSGDDGAIYLMGGMDVDSVQVSGTLDASAPQVGDGGFIETSAANVNVADNARITTIAARGNTGNWLIDPVDYYVRPTGGNITGSQLGVNLNTTNVTIETTTGTGGNGDIFIRDNISKTTGSATTLTLLAYRNIVVGHTNSNIGNNSPTVTISGSANSPLGLHFSARASGQASGHVELVKATLLTYGGDLTIGGGDNAASGHAVAQGVVTYNDLNSTPADGSAAGVRMRDSIINASSDASQTSATYQDWLGSHTYLTAGSSSGTGGNVVIKGRGNSTFSSGSANLGVWLYAGTSIATSGNGTIRLDGTGGNGSNVYGGVGSTGVLLEGRGSLLAQSGSISINGQAGNGQDAYGVGFTEGGGLVRTGGSLAINASDGTPSDDNDNAVLIRDGVMTFDVGGSSSIEAPLLGAADNRFPNSPYSFVTMGAGTFTLSGDAMAWNLARPANTSEIRTTGTYTVQGSGSLALANGLSNGQALASFWTSVSGPAQSSTLQFSLGAVGKAGGELAKRLTKSERIDLILRGLAPSDVTQEEMQVALTVAKFRRAENEQLKLIAIRNGDVFALAKYGPTPQELARAKSVRAKSISLGLTPRGRLLPGEAEQIRNVQKEREKLIARGIAPKPIVWHERVRLNIVQQNMIASGITPPGATREQQALAQKNRRDMIARGVAPSDATRAERITAARKSAGNFLRSLFRR